MDDLNAYPTARYIRSTSKWRQLRNRFRDHCRRSGQRCYWCCSRGDKEFAQIDYDAPANSPWAFEADHVEPVERRPDLAYAWENLVPSHSRCNRQKGVKSYEQQGDWVQPDW